MDIEEPAATVCPTRRLKQRLMRPIVEGLGILHTRRLQDAAKIFEMFARALALRSGE